MLKPEQASTACARWHQALEGRLLCPQYVSGQYASPALQACPFCIVAVDMRSFRLGSVMPHACSGHPHAQAPLRACPAHSSQSQTCYAMPISLTGVSLVTRMNLHSFPADWSALGPGPAHSAHAAGMRACVHCRAAPFLAMQCNFSGSSCCAMLHSPSEALHTVHNPGGGLAACQPQAPSRFVAPPRPRCCTICHTHNTLHTHCTCLTPTRMLQGPLVALTLLAAWLFSLSATGLNVLNTCTLTGTLASPCICSGCGGMQGPDVWVRPVHDTARPAHVPPVAATVDTSARSVELPFGA